MIVTTISNETIQAAKNQSLLSLCQSLGYTPYRVGSQYSLKEMDSIRIYNDRTWNRFSGKGNINGGTTIDFIMEFAGLSFHEAVEKLTEGSYFLTERPSKEFVKENTPIKKEKKDFTLPAKADNYKRVYAYLMQERCLSKTIIDYFINKGLLYEENERHNLVFLGTDINGTVKYATKRGTLTGEENRYRGDVSGSDKNYNLNITNKASDTLHIFESCIDLMSYMDLHRSCHQNFLALGMLSDKPLLQFLKEHSNVRRLNFHLDNDGSAIKAIYGNGAAHKKEGLLAKYMKNGYQVSITNIPKSSGKDINELLTKKELTFL